MLALGYNTTDANITTLEILVWDSPMENFLDDVFFDLFDVLIGDPSKGLITRDSKVEL